MKKHLQGRDDFQKVYRNGKRFEGSLITVFVLLNDKGSHRFGVTASRKVIGAAVQRNRAKRLLRESFRLSNSLLEELRRRYDWVLNAKRKLSGRKLSAALEEFSAIIEKVAKEEATLVPL